MCFYILCEYSVNVTDDQRESTAKKQHLSCLEIHTKKWFLSFLETARIYAQKGVIPCWWYVLLLSVHVLNRVTAKVHNMLCTANDIIVQWIFYQYINLCNGFKYHSETMHETENILNVAKHGQYCKIFHHYDYITKGDL